MMSTKTRFEKEAKSDLEMAHYPEQIFTRAYKTLAFFKILPLSLAMHPPASS